MLVENVKDKKIKKIRSKGTWKENTPDFHINGPTEDPLIDLQNGGLDHINAFNCSMHNFGEFEDLPESDRAMIRSDQTVIRR
jgi:hypothetical protein